jgi:hypothetical protein
MVAEISGNLAYAVGRCRTHLAIVAGQGDLITRRSQVQILPPLLQTAPYGAVCDSSTGCSTGGLPVEGSFVFLVGGVGVLGVEEVGEGRCGFGLHAR